MNCSFIYIFNCFLFLTISYSIIQAQNQAPTADQLIAEPDFLNNRLQVHYELFDAENDSITVWLKVSHDGISYQIPESNLSGDVGKGLLSGSKTLIYAPSEEIDWQTLSLKLVVWDNQTPDVQRWVDEVEESWLIDQLQWLEGTRHYGGNRPKLEAVKDSLETAFRSAGLESWRQGFVYLNQNGENIIGRKTGLKNEKNTWIIDGHFDTVNNTPGADDNGTAVAAMLQVLHILKDKTFEESINFIGFDFEEAGLIGSQRYVQNGIRNFEEIQGVYNMEMIGFYSNQPNSQQLPIGFNILFPDASAAIAADQFRGNFITNVANDPSASLRDHFAQSAAQYVPDLKVITLSVPGNGSIAPDLRRSDHAPFWDRNMKALMITDGANFRNQNYHTPGDSVATINATFFRQVTQAVLGALVSSAKPLNGNTYDLGLLVSTSDAHQHKAPLVQIFPNPVSTELTIRILGATEALYQVALYSLDGIRHAQVHMRGNSATTMNVQHLSPATYLLVVNDKENSVARELVIRR
jgi:hypothetical protein